MISISSNNQNKVLHKSVEPTEDIVASHYHYHFYRFFMQDQIVDYTPDYAPDPEAEEFDYENFDYAPDSPRRRRSRRVSRMEEITPAMAAGAGSSPKPNTRPIVPPPMDDESVREHWADPTEEERKAFTKLPQLSNIEDLPNVKKLLERPELTGPSVQESQDTLSTPRVEQPNIQATSAAQTMQTAQATQSAQAMQTAQAMQAAQTMQAAQAIQAAQAVQETQASQVAQAAEAQNETDEDIIDTRFSEMPTYEISDTWREATERLLAAPDESEVSFVDLKIWALERLIILSGITIEHALMIKNGDLDLYDSSCKLALSNGTRVPVSLPAEVMEALDLYSSRRQGEAEDYLFCDEQGEQMNIAICYEQMRRYHKKRNAECIPLNALRRLYL